MPKQKLREAIAAEAARLILRGKEGEYASARKRAARWLSRRKVAAADVPSQAEIQSQVFVLAGLFSAEHQKAALSRMRSASFELLEILAGFHPRVFGSAVTGPVMAGSQIEISVTSDSLDAVVVVLEEAGFFPRLNYDIVSDTPIPARIRIHHIFPCEISVAGSHCPPESLDAVTEQNKEVSVGVDGLDVDELQALISTEAEQAAAVEFVDSEIDSHPDTYAAMRLLLSPLANVKLDSQRHPEGDALYHSLQVFELGLNEHPYDEEFLLACLLHDVGRAIDRRHPIEAAIYALGNLITERTRFLIERRVDAMEYLQTGQVARSLRRSEDFDDLVLLARCDLGGRRPGMPVRELDEALDYIAGLHTAWDDV